MKIAIMQPYIFPYIGYFQLIHAVDKFVVYDNIQFTKKGWINRNRILVNGHDDYFTIPLKKDSDYLNVDQRKLADTYDSEKLKLLRKFTESYKKAPEFSFVYPLIESMICQNEDNLFRYIYTALIAVNAYLGIETELVISSSIPVDHSLKSQDKVLAICKALHATTYINPIGGTALYSKEVFKKNEIDLHFLQSHSVQYMQFNNEFVPWLSIIDVLMFNPKEKVKQYLEDYSIS